MKKTIGLLYGGTSSEREISILSAKSVGQCLKRLGYNIVKIDVGPDLVEQIQNKPFDIAFIALHGRYGEDGCLQGLLEVLEIQYTHSGVLASAVCMNKIVAKAIFSDLGIDIAEGKMLSKNQILREKILWDKKHVIKPVNEGSSVNVYIIENQHSFTQDNYPFIGDVMVEEFIPGREIQVGIVVGNAIGAVEVIPTQRDFYDYDTKYTEGMAQHICPAELPEHIYKKSLENAKKVYDFLKCRGIARADFRYDEKRDRLVMLEFNTHPGFTELSLVPEIAYKCANISFDELVELCLSDTE